MHWTDELFDGPYDREYEELTAEDLERASREAEFIMYELGLKDSDRVLDFACGHGRHAVVIAQHITEVVGLDRTKKYIDYAKKYADEHGIANIKYIVGDMRELDFESEFDAAYNYFTAWGYWDDDTNQDVLNRISRALKPGGQFLLEFIHRDSLIRRFQEKGWYQIDDDNYMLEDRHFDSETGHSRSKRIYINTSGKNKDVPPVRKIDVSVRIPTGSEFKRMFGDAGFSETRLVEAPTGDELTIDSRRIAVIGHKPI